MVHCYITEIAIRKRSQGKSSQNLQRPVRRRRNGKLGTRIKATSGVAQRCVLSPLLFDVYIDDLLHEFRKHELGVPTGHLIQGPLSLADDLGLIAANKHVAM